MAQQRVSRRRFVGIAAAAMASPSIVRAAAGAAVSSRANERITLGFIGTGIRARNLMNGYFLKNDRVRILAVCDVDTTRREHYQNVVNENYGDTGCSAYNDYHELLARDDIDAVVIATPDHWHTIPAIEAVVAGKDVYCEKPLTHSLDESRLIIEAVRKHGRVFQTGSQQRCEYGQRFVKAVEYVRNGRIGKLLNINVGVGDPPKACDLPPEKLEPGLDWDRWLGPAPQRPYNSVLSPRGVHGHYPAWRAYWEYSGGYFADMGAHHYDIAQWGLKADDAGPVEVIPPEDNQSMRGVRLVFPGGAVVTHGGPTGTTFIGTDGMIHVDRGRLIPVPGNIFDTPIGDDDEHLPRHKTHADNWLDCIMSRERPIADVEIGARTAALCHLVNLAYRHRRPLRWDHAAWRFIDDDEANTWLDTPRREGFELPAF